MQHSLNQVRMIATDMDGTLLNSQDLMPRDFLIYSIKFTNSEFFLSLPAGGHTQPLPCSLKAAWTSLFLWLKTADVSSTASSGSSGHS